MFECHCLCHGDPEIEHCMPCCETCPRCLLNVTDLKAHLEVDHLPEIEYTEEQLERLSKLPSEFKDLPCDEDDDL